MGLILAFLAELCNFASVPASVAHLTLADGQAAIALIVGDKEPRVRGLDLLAVLVPDHLGVGVVHLAAELDALGRLTVLLDFQLLLETILRIRGCLRKKENLKIGSL